MEDVESRAITFEELSYVLYFLNSSCSCINFKMKLWLYFPTFRNIWFASFDIDLNPIVRFSSEEELVGSFGGLDVPQTVRLSLPDAELATCTILIFSVWASPILPFR